MPAGLRVRPAGILGCRPSCSASRIALHSRSLSVWSARNRKLPEPQAGSSTVKRAQSGPGRPCRRSRPRLRASAWRGLAVLSGGSSASIARLPRPIPPPAGADTGSMIFMILSRSVYCSNERRKVTAAEVLGAGRSEQVLHPPGVEALHEERAQDRRVDLGPVLAAAALTPPGSAAGPSAAPAAPPPASNSPPLNQRTRSKPSQPPVAIVRNSCSASASDSAGSCSASSSIRVSICRGSRPMPCANMQNTSRTRNRATRSGWWPRARRSRARPASDKARSAVICSRVRPGFRRSGSDEDPLEGLALAGIGEILEPQLDPPRDGVGPVGDDQEPFEIADHQQRRVLQRQGILLELRERVVEIAPLPLYSQAKCPRFQTSAQPRRPEALSAPLLEAVLAVGILGRLRLAQELAQIEEVRLRRLPLTERRELPLGDELLRRHLCSHPHLVTAPRTRLIAEHNATRAAPRLTKRLLVSASFSFKNSTHTFTNAACEPMAHPRSTMEEVARMSLIVRAFAVRPRSSRAPGSPGHLVHHPHDNPKIILIIPVTHPATMTR